MDKNSIKNIWEFLGKTAAVITIFLFVVWIISQCSSEQYDIDVRGVLRPTNMLPLAFKDIYKSSFTHSYLYEDERRIIDSTTILNKIESEIINFTTYAQLTIKNNSSQKIVESKLKLPANGIAVLKKENDSIYTFMFNKVIDLAEFQPMGKKYLELWLKPGIPSISKEDFSFTHKNGTAKVIFASEVFGILSFVHDHDLLNPYILISLFSILMMLYILVSIIWDWKIKPIFKAQNKPDEEID